MKCNDREKLFEFVEHMLKPREEEAVQSHVAGCSECGRIVEEYQKLHVTLDDWKAAEPTPWFDARVRASAASSGVEARGFPIMGRMRTLAVGVLSLFLVVGSFVAVHRYRLRENAMANQIWNNGQGPAFTADQEVKMYENLPVLEDYDMLANFDVLSELPQSGN